MKLVLRLLGYMRPYVLYWIISVLLMGVVGALAAFRVLLIKPIIDNVLSAASSPDKVLNFVIPHTHRSHQLAGSLTSALSQCVDGGCGCSRRFGNHQESVRLSRHIASQ